MDYNLSTECKNNTYRYTYTEREKRDTERKERAGERLRNEKKNQSSISVIQKVAKNKTTFFDMFRSLSLCKLSQSAYLMECNQRLFLWLDFQSSFSLSLNLLLPLSASLFFLFHSFYIIGWGEDFIPTKRVSCIFSDPKIRIGIPLEISSPERVKEEEMRMRRAFWEIEATALNSSSSNIIHSQKKKMTDDNNRFCGRLEYLISLRSWTRKHNNNNHIQISLSLAPFSNLSFQILHSLILIIIYAVSC